MSCRVDTAPLFASSCVVSEYPGHGIRGDAVPTTGTHGASPVLNNLSLPADAAKEYRITNVTPITAGWSVVAYENTSVEITPPGGLVNGEGQYQFNLWEDGVNLGVVTKTVVVGTGAGVVINASAAITGDAAGTVAAAASISQVITADAAVTEDVQGTVATSALISADLTATATIEDSLTGVVSADVFMTGNINALPTIVDAGQGVVSASVAVNSASEDVTASGALTTVVEGVVNAKTAIKGAGDTTLETIILGSGIVGLTLDGRPVFVL